MEDEGLLAVNSILMFNDIDGCIKKKDADIFYECYYMYGGYTPYYDIDGDYIGYKREHYIVDCDGNEVESYWDL